jgi:hypothetical protein
MERAIGHSPEVMSRSLEENVLRTLDVKLEAARNPRATPAVVQLLIGHEGRGPDKARAAEALGVWSTAVPNDGLPEYLLARSSINAGQFDDAAKRLDRALAAGLPITRVAAEAVRLRIVAACALGDNEMAVKMADEYLARTDVFLARRQAVARFVARCTGKTKGAP